MRIAAVLLTTFLAIGAGAHPGASIAVSQTGVVYFVDTGGGLYAIETDGRIVRREGPAFHWFAFDPAGRFRTTRWPAIPGAEFRAAGTNPTLVLSSDYPVTIGSDGNFYYPDGRSGDRIRIVAIAPSGAQSIRATLPPMRDMWLNGLASASDGSLYFTDDHTVRKIDRRGAVTTVATITVQPCTAIPGISAAERPDLRGLAIAADGTVYVAASGCGALVKIDAQGRVTTVLRTTAPWSPTGVAVSGRDVYVLEYSHTASDDRREWMPRVRELSPNGQVRVVGAITRR